MSDLPPPPPSSPPPPPPGFGTPPPPGYTTYGTPPATAAYAGVGARFGAMLIDSIIVTLFSVPAIVALFAGPTEIEACSVNDAGDITIGGELNALCEGPTNGTWAMFAVLMVAAVIAGLVYYARGEGKGQTIGKKALSIKVVDVNTNAPIGTGRALGRYFARFLSSFFFGLGYLWAIWDPKKQTWHDKIVSSAVVQA